jgi:hypothetical protein
VEGEGGEREGRGEGAEGEGSGKGVARGSYVLRQGCRTVEWGLVTRCSGGPTVCLASPSPSSPPQLEAGRGARSAALNEDEQLSVKNLGLLTLKPLIYAANVGEDDLGNQGANNVHVQVDGRTALDAQGPGPF